MYRIPETGFPGHVWRRHEAGDKIAGLGRPPLSCWLCRYCEEPAYTEHPYVKPDPDVCPLPRECGPICTLPAPEYPQPSLHADSDDVYLEDVIYWCEAAYVGRRRDDFQGIRAVAAQVVGDYEQDARLHLDLRVIPCQGPRSFAAGQRITRTLDALAATGVFTTPR